MCMVGAAPSNCNTNNLKLQMLQIMMQHVPENVESNEYSKLNNLLPTNK